MRRGVSTILICVLAASVFTSCSGVQETDVVPASSAERTSAASASGISSDASDTQYANEFDPHVYPSIYEENFDGKTKESFFSLCDAMLAGEDEFDCEDDVMFYTVVFTIAHQCFPLVELMGDGWTVNDGKAHINYSLPKDQYLQKAEEFKSLTVSILDECIKPGYDDTDKALSVYSYFVTHYTYDYDALGDDVMGLSSYRLLTERKGICQEIAPAYAYILLQAHVDCTTCGSLNDINEAHEWALAKLDGEYYHIDPTFGINEPGSLRYFGMTDEERQNQGGWNITILNYGNANIFDDSGKYSADSRRFEALWTAVNCDTDYETNTVRYFRDGENEQYEFTY